MAVAHVANYLLTVESNGESGNDDNLQLMEHDSDEVNDTHIDEVVKLVVSMCRALIMQAVMPLRGNTV